MCEDPTLVGKVSLLGLVGMRAWLRSEERGKGRGVSREGSFFIQERSDQLATRSVKISLWQPPHYPLGENIH